MGEAANASVRIAGEGDGPLRIEGPLTFETAREAHRQGLARLESSTSGALVVDCSGVTEADSAGLAMLVDWLAWAREKGRSLELVGTSQRLRALAAISEVEDLLEGRAY